MSKYCGNQPRSFQAKRNWSAKSNDAGRLSKQGPKKLIWRWQWGDPYSSLRSFSKGVGAKSCVE